MTDIQEQTDQDENRLECNDEFITEAFEIAFGDGARDKYTNEEAVEKLREFSDNALKFEEAENNGSITTRKIIQILQLPMDDSNEGNMVALCDDGTIWHDAQEGWTIHDERIPQGEWYQFYNPVEPV